MNMKYKLSKDWISTRKIVLFGCGERTRNYIEFLKKHYEVMYILDSNKEKCGKKFNGIDVKWFNEIVMEGKEKLKEHKIILTAFGDLATEMGMQLGKYGLIEYKDFCEFEEWAIESMWRQMKKVQLYNINISITSRCTLKCKHCSMFIPYYQQLMDYNISDFQYNIDLLFSHIDYLFQLTIMGGEPLLNKDLGEMLKWIAQKYKGKLEKIFIISNGTVLPTKKLLQICSQSKIEITFLLSDYTDEVPYKTKLNEVIKLLEEAKIRYIRRVNRDLLWQDLCFPVNKFPVEKGKEREHMLNCNPFCRAINDGKLYYCHMLWSANKCGLIKEEKGDYLDLESLSKETGKLNIMNHYRGDILREGGSLSLCAVCGGFGADNNRRVKAGVQVKDKNNL